MGWYPCIHSYLFFHTHFVAPALIELNMAFGVTTRVYVRGVTGVLAHTELRLRTGGEHSQSVAGASRVSFVVCFILF